MAIIDPIPREEAEELSARVQGVEGVAGLHAGAFGEASLLYPGARVKGLKLRGSENQERLEVHIVADLSHVESLDELASQVRGAIAHTAHNRPVDVIVADVVATANT